MMSGLATFLRNPEPTSSVSNIKASDEVVQKLGSEFRSPSDNSVFGQAYNLTDDTLSTGDYTNAIPKSKPPIGTASSALAPRTYLDATMDSPYPLKWQDWAKFPQFEDPYLGKAIKIHLINSKASKRFLLLLVLLLLPNLISSIQPGIPLG